MTFFQRLKAGVKFALHERWGDQYASRRASILQGVWNLQSNVDFVAEAGDVSLNSAVGAVLGWMCDEVCKAQIQVVRTMADGSEEPVFNHPLVTFIENPNPYQSYAEISTAIYRDYVVDGNAYVLLVEGLGADLVEYWHIPTSRIQPRWPLDGSQFIGWYDVIVDGIPRPVPVESIVHFRDGKDPTNERLGLSRLKAGLRAVSSHNQAEAYTFALLKNMGMPGLLFSATDPTHEFGEDAVKRLKGTARAGWGGDKRFEPMVLDMPVKVDTMGFSPEQLRLEKLPAFNEATICALIGVSPMVVSLPSAALHNTYANAADARVGAWSRLQAIQRSIGMTLTRQLLPRFQSGNAKSLKVCWDYSKVDALTEDADKRAARAREGYTVGILYKSEARELGYGLESELADELYVNGVGPGAVVDDMQAKTLNGSQLANLVSILEKIADKQLAPESARALLLAALPVLTEEQVNAIIDPSITFTPAPDPVMDAAGNLLPNPSQDNSSGGQQARGERGGDATEVEDQDDADEVKAMVNGQGHSGAWPR